MATSVETKDCTALTDAELAEMADLAADQPARYDIGVLSKQREEWVLVTRAHVGSVLHGYAFATLERIGGTPSVLIGLAAVKASSKRNEVLRALLGDLYRRAVLAFPDEDVVIGTRFGGPSGFEAYAVTKLVDIVPRPGHKPSGEERAWGRRFAKRFGVEGDYDDRAFISRSEPPAMLFDFESLKPEKLDPEVVALFDEVDPTQGACLVAFGWAMAEDLAKLA